MEESFQRAAQLVLDTLELYDLETEGYLELPSQESQDILVEVVENLAGHCPSGILPLPGRYYWLQFLRHLQLWEQEAKAQNRKLFANIRHVLREGHPPENEPSVQWNPHESLDSILDPLMAFTEWLIRHFKLVAASPMPVDLNQSETEILQVVDNTPKLGRAIAMASGYADGTVRQILPRLARRGLVVRIKGGYVRM